MADGGERARLVRDHIQRPAGVSTSLQKDTWEVSSSPGTPAPTREKKGLGRDNPGPSGQRVQDLFSETKLACPLEL